MQKKNMTMGLDEAVETQEKENNSKVTTLEEAKKKSSVVPSMNKFLKLLLIERLDGIKEELDSLRDMLAIYLDEQGDKEFVQKMLAADDADDAQEFLNLVEKAEDPE